MPQSALNLRRAKRLIRLLTVGGLIAATAPAAGARGGAGCDVTRRAGCVAWAQDRPLPSPHGRKDGRAVATSADGTLVYVAADGTDLAYEAATGKLRWAVPNGTSGAVGAQDIGLSPSGRLVVSAGGTSVPDARRVWSQKMVVMAHDPATGRPAWQARPLGADDGASAAGRVAVTDSRVFVAGQFTASHDLVVLAVDALTGRTSWVADHAAAPAVPAEPVAVVATPGGERVFVTAISWEDKPYVQWLTVAYDGATGKQLWVTHHRGDDSAAQPNGMVLSPGGDLLYVTGWNKQERPLGAGFGFLTVAYDTASGSPVWSGMSSSASRADELAWSVDVDPDGRRLYVAGFTGGASAGYRLEARQARTGQILWSSFVPLLTPTQDHEGLFGLARVRSSRSGRQVYVAMSAQDGASPGGDDPCYAVAGFDAATGRLLWRATYAGQRPGSARHLEDLAVDPGGSRVFVTGQEAKPGSSMVETVAFETRASGAGPEAPAVGQMTDQARSSTVETRSSLRRVS
ncbi:MAG TPA: PQQ-binding-like beta-propeller repeat protein [Acidimicrobiia bacterium]